MVFFREVCSVSGTLFVAAGRKLEWGVFEKDFWAEHWR